MERMKCTSIYEGESFFLALQMCKLNWQLYKPDKDVLRRILFAVDLKITDRISRFSGSFVRARTGNGRMPYYRTRSANFPVIQGSLTYLLSLNLLSFKILDDEDETFCSEDSEVVIGGITEL